MWLPFLNWFVEIIAREEFRWVRRRRGCGSSVWARWAMAWAQVTRRTRSPWASRMAWLLGVVLAGEAVVVPFGAVGLDDQVLVGPAEVGDDRAAVDRERLVDVGTLEPRIEDEVEDGVLEFAAGGGVAGGEDLREVGDAAAGAEAVEGVEDLGDGDEVALGFADGAS